MRGGVVDLEISLRPDPANPRRPIVGAGPAAELEQLTDEAVHDWGRAEAQLYGYVIALANHHKRVALRAAAATGISDIKNSTETLCP